MHLPCDFSPLFFVTSEVCNVASQHNLGEVSGNDFGVIVLDSIECDPELSKFFGSSFTSKEDLRNYPGNKENHLLN